MRAERQQAAAGRAHGEGSAAEVRIEADEPAAAARVPQSYSVIQRSGSEGGFSVDFDRGEAHDRAFMPLENAEGFAAPRVPQSYSVIVRSGSEGGFSVDFDRGEAGDEV